MRKLVTIRKISKLIPIAGADLICLAVVDGWQVIVKKDEFKEGDYCLFFEVDSFLPESDTRFSFLKKSQDYIGFKGYRLKTMKMRGVLSQGLALPVHMFIEDLDLYDSVSIEEAVTDGTDFSEQLKVIKYDNQNTGNGGLNAGNAEGRFPTFIPKTDQERVQNLTSYFETMVDEEFEETLKLDGSSMTCYKIDKPIGIFSKIKKFFGFKVKDYHFGVCSRNLEIKLKEEYSNINIPVVNSDFWKAAISQDIENKIPKGYAIQGELIGPKIQANHEKVQELDYQVFDVYNINEARYLLPSERYDFVNTYSIKHVPIVNKSFKPFNLTLQELLDRVVGPSFNGGISEGRVYKHITKDISFKVISNEYLLKSEK